MSLNLDKKVYDLLNENADLQPFLISIGFDNFKNLEAIQAVTKIMTLRKILNARGIAIDDFNERYSQFSGLAEDKPQIALEDAEIIIKGALPCPTKDKILAAYDENFGDGQLKIYSDLKSASLGVDFVEQGELSVDDLPDVFVSPGFKFPFLDERAKPLYNKDNFLQDVFNYNATFEPFKDPEGVFQIAGGVPCVFLVNNTAHSDGECPRSWADLIDPSKDVEITLPMGDLDVVNAVLLTIHSHYGEAGVDALLAKCTRNMHPSQMVKTMLQNKIKTSINIIPYFFGTMAERNGNVEVIWPEDGAILSPIFMAFKRQKQAQLKPVIDFFSSEKFAISMYADGKFPSSLVGIDNRLPGNFKWVGWDYVHNNNLEKLMKKYEELL